MDRSQARCSFCGKRPPEVRRMVSGPGAAYICESCLKLCSDILDDPSPFSAKALELASRAPVVVAAPLETRSRDLADTPKISPTRIINIELEQKQQDMMLMLQQLLIFEKHFELHYIWIRPPLQAGFAFVPRLVFLLQDNTGYQWSGDRGGMLLARPELSSDTYNKAVYQGSARFSPPLSTDPSALIIRAIDPLGQLEDPPLQPWEFEITL
jgi:ClpX C4-type zinc finger protein